MERDLDLERELEREVGLALGTLETRARKLLSWGVTWDLALAAAVWKLDEARLALARTRSGETVVRDDWLRSPVVPPETQLQERYCTSWTSPVQPAASPAQPAPAPAQPKSRAWVAQVMERVFRDCQQLREAGQKEYAHEEGNAFGNFERSGVELQIAPAKALWLFMNKHRDGVLAWINGHRSQRESVHGRIRDWIVYLVLLDALIEWVESGERGAGSSAT